MSQQMSLDRFFKNKANATRNMDGGKVSTKRKSLSLKKNSTPPKTPKVNNIIKSVEENNVDCVIDLCSDDEVPTVKTEPWSELEAMDKELSLKMNDESLLQLEEFIDKSEPGLKTESETMNKSELNLKLSPIPSLNISQSSNDTINSSSSTSTVIYNWTPKKTPESTRSFKSPSSSGKFYSPTKKRKVTKRSPFKRNLSFGEHSVKSEDDEDFNEACNGMDDKSIFLLTLINNYLKDENIKNLLQEETQELLSRCLCLAKPGIRLVCRLFWRQHIWYTTESLKKIVSAKNETIDDPTFQQMMVCLVDNGVVIHSADKDISFEEYTKILKGDDIKQICKEFKIKMQSETKQAAVEALKKFSKRPSISFYFSGNTASNASRINQVMKSKAGLLYKLSEPAQDALYKLHLLMYLGVNFDMIREKKLELMLINDKIKSETFPVDKSMTVDSAAVVFRSRDEFSRYYSAHIIYENYLTETDTYAKCNVVNKVFNLYNSMSEEGITRCKSYPLWLHRFTPLYIYIKILESGIQELKKTKTKEYYKLAIDILNKLINQKAFRQHKKAEWYAEKALILHQALSEHNEAAQVLLKGLTSDLSDELKAAMRPRAVKIAKQLNIDLEDDLRNTLLEQASKDIVLEKQFQADHVNKKHMETNNQRGKKKFEVRTEDDTQYLAAEDYCVTHYTSNGPDWTHGEHWEGRIVTTIFFLLFWDIIYSKPRGVQGVFLSHFQSYPLDMFYESFYTNRKSLIDERLASIEAMEVDTMVDIIRNKWEERPESEISGINRNIGLDNVIAVSRCLGGRCTAAICRRLAINYGHTHSGFPDLTLWNVFTNKITFVEVKTDTDKPSIKQLQWMKYLKDNQIDTGFCYLGVNTTRCRARNDKNNGQ